MVTRRRVIVVGAGFAGLAAARRLPTPASRPRCSKRASAWAARVVDDAHERRRRGARRRVDHGRRLGRAGDRRSVRGALADTGASYGRREPWGPDAASLEAQDRFIEPRTQPPRWPRPKRRRRAVGAFLEAVEGDGAAKAIVMMRLAGTCASDLYDVALASFDGDRPFSASEGPVRASGRWQPGDRGRGRCVAAGCAARPRGGSDRAERARRHGAGGITCRTRRRGGGGDPGAHRGAHGVRAGVPDDLGSALATLSMGDRLEVRHGDEAASAGSIATVRQPLDVVLDGAGSRSEGAPLRDRVRGLPRGPGVARVARGELTPWLEAVRSMNPDLTLVDEPVLYAWADDPYTLGGTRAGIRLVGSTRGVLAPGRPGRVRG